MSEIAKDSPLLKIMPIHFDIESGGLPIGDFIKTAQAAEAIMSTLNKEIFENGFKYELIVLPPQDGSFKMIIGIACFMVIPAWFGALDTDVAKAFVRGLTGHEPAYWAEQIGEDIAELLPDGNREEYNKNEDEKSYSTYYNINILSDCTKEFLQKDYSELQKTGISKIKFETAYKAKNKFYETCTRNSFIKAVGFDDTEDFSVKRKRFPNLIEVIQKEEKAEIKPCDIFVTSPNWEEDDKPRRWKGRYFDETISSDRFILFSVEDNYFWELVKAGEIVPTGIDKMEVQWRIDEKERQHAIVIRVLRYNDKEVSSPIPDPMI